MRYSRGFLISMGFVMTLFTYTYVYEFLLCCKAQHASGALFVCVGELRLGISEKLDGKGFSAVG